MSEIKNGGSDQYGAEPFEQQQFETAGVEGLMLVFCDVCRADSTDVTAATWVTVNEAAN